MRSSQGVRLLRYIQNLLKYICYNTQSQLLKCDILEWCRIKFPFVYLKAKCWGVREKERDKENVFHQLIHSKISALASPEPGGSQDPGFNVGGRESSTWAIFHCLTRYISRELDQKESSCNSNQCFDMGHQQWKLNILHHSVSPFFALNIRFFFPFT